MATREVIVELKVTGPAFDQFAKLTQQQNTAREAIRALKKELRELQPAAANFAAETARINKELAKQDVIASNAGVQMRELRNKLNGATDAGLRFRDKMAEASRAGLGAFGLQAAGIASITLAVINLAKETFALSQQMEKTDARNRAIAGDSLPALTSAAEANANAIGLTRREYVSLAADQQLRLKNLGIEGDLVTELAIKTVDYADQLSDFSAGQLTTEQAARLLNDALTGQTRGLKELGINVKASKEEIEAQAQVLMSTKGLTEEQATAVATLELAFSATAETMNAFGGEALALDKAMDASNARLKEAKEALAEGLTPALIAATEGQARFTQSLATFADSSGFRKAVAVLTAGVSEQILGGWEALFGTIDEAAKAAPDAKEAAEATAAIFSSVAPAEVTAERTRSLKELREELKGLKEAREKLLETDTKGLADSAAQIAALEKRIKAIDGTTEATKKLTEAEKARLAILNQISADVQANPFAVTPGDIQPVGQADEPVDNSEVVEANYDRLRELSAQFFADELTGLRDFANERALLEAEYMAGRIESKEEYLRRIEAINEAEVDSERMKLAGVASVVGAIGELFDQESAEAKAAATIQALINTYLGASMALTDKTIPNTFARIAAAATVILTGLAQVKKINGFKEGGFTSKRASDREEVGAVHANEWVAPAWQTRHPVYGPQIKALEVARKRRGLDMGMSGFASGGPTGNTYTFSKATGLAPQTGSGTIAQADLSRAIMNMPAPVISISEFRDVERRVNIIERMSR